MEKPNLFIVTVVGFNCRKEIGEEGGGWRRRAATSRQYENSLLKTQNITVNIKFTTSHRTLKLILKNYA